MTQPSLSKSAPDQPLRVVQLSDSHLGQREGDTLLGMNTDESLQDVLNILPESDVIVASGDISNDGSAASYRRFVKTVMSAAQVPLYCLAGNHDDDQVMAQTLVDTQCLKSVALGGWRLVFLNSRVPGFEHGDFTHHEMKILTDCLAAHSGKPTVIFLHHQVVPVGSAWIDQYQLRCHAAFLAVLSHHPQVKAVCWGHVHQAFHQHHQGIDLFACPSTCVQFKPQCDPFALDDRMPGLRVLELFADGRLESHIVRAPHRGYGIDFKAGGY